ncbi:MULTISPECIES: universal stress protein [unclassified Sporosarcina]|uniref:universal stress protein n=1 Tax=unclassified Sporosarcina TaxID=2647733 RepID=UPI000C16D810|nr:MULTISPECIES: universal stress protein [unclassified Sporosarcina]PIC99070.1 universal stress protein [Sporosarcina sp. P29]PID05536.1 universal stress protein [Sporosarcina sp. P30]PID08730.1 universal stress protein [Sporosarcina sp. P31]PID11902.1 universal stress protein [Sporosarcina sp. P32b]
MKIAVAVDGSDNSLRATDYAIMLMQQFSGAKLELIHVIDFNKEDERLLKQSPNSLDKYQKKKLQSALKLVKDKGIVAEVTVLQGNPHQQIIKHVNTNEIDHLILSSRGLRLLKNLVMGSVSQKVIKHVNSSVTIIK